MKVNCTSPYLFYCIRGILNVSVALRNALRQLRNISCFVSQQVVMWGRVYLEATYMSIRISEVQPVCREMCFINTLLYLMFLSRNSCDIF